MLGISQILHILRRSIRSPNPKFKLTCAAPLRTPWALTSVYPEGGLSAARKAESTVLGGTGGGNVAKGAEEIPPVHGGGASFDPPPNSFVIKALNPRRGMCNHSGRGGRN